MYMPACLCATVAGGAGQHAPCCCLRTRAIAITMCPARQRRVNQSTLCSFVAVDPVQKTTFFLYHKRMG
jgi:hypothetical protein